MMTSFRHKQGKVFTKVFMNTKYFGQVFKYKYEYSLFLSFFVIIQTRIHANTSVPAFISIQIRMLNTNTPGLIGTLKNLPRICSIKEAFTLTNLGNKVVMCLASISSWLGSTLFSKATKNDDRAFSKLPKLRLVSPIRKWPLKEHYLTIIRIFIHLFLF